MVFKSKILVTSTLFLSTFCFALDFYYIKEDDKGVVESSSHIIGGVVTDILQEVSLNKRCEEEYCFRYVYKFQITEVIKGSVSIGDTVTVGLFNSDFPVDVGQKLFGTFGKYGFHSDEKCQLGSAKGIYKSDKRDYLININLLNASLFEVFNDAGTEKFRVVRCGNNRLMFGDDKSLYSGPVVKERESGKCDYKNGDYHVFKQACDYYEGSYDALKSKFKNITNQRDN